MVISSFVAFYLYHYDIMTRLIHPSYFYTVFLLCRKIR